MTKTVVPYFSSTRFTVDVQNRDSGEYINELILDISVVIFEDCLHCLYLNVCSHQSGKRGR